MLNFLRKVKVFIPKFYKELGVIVQVILVIVAILTKIITSLT